MNVLHIYQLLPTRAIFEVIDIYNIKKYDYQTIYYNTELSSKEYSKLMVK